MIAVFAAVLQPQVANDAQPLRSYLMLWVLVAALALLIVLSDMVFRYYRDPPARARRRTIDVLSRLSPDIVVGAALTANIYSSAPDIA